MAYALFGVLPKDLLFLISKESHTLKNVYVSIDIHCSKVPKLIFLTSTFGFLRLKSHSLLYVSSAYIQIVAFILFASTLFWSV